MSNFAVAAAAVAGGHGGLGVCQPVVPAASVVRAKIKEKEEGWAASGRPFRTQLRILFEFTCRFCLISI